MSASMMPVKTCRMKTVSAALPKTYHQLADLRGTGCSVASRIAPPICSRCSNQSPMRLLALTSAAPRLAGCAGRKRRQLSGFNHQLAVLHFVLVLEQSALRRPGSARAILVVHAAVARAHEQARLREPAHRASEVRAVDGEDLELSRRDRRRTQQGMLSVSPSETPVIGFLNFASRVWFSGNSSSSPSAIQRL